MNDFVIFRLGSSEWALPAETVQQALSPRPVTRLPEPPPLVRGLVAWRSKVLPVLGLGERLACADPPIERCALLVIEVGGELAALAVDRVLHLAQPMDLDAASVPVLDVEQVCRGE
jgi:purine-binding chemotaxis protein CheW